MKTFLLTVLATLSATQVVANPFAPTQVPEISTLEAAAALAAVAAVVLLAWERRRKTR